MEQQLIALAQMFDKRKSVKEFPTDEGDLKEVFDYDQYTGDFRWLIHVPANNIKAGTMAGYRSEEGYVALSYNNYRMKAHRVAWYLHYGYWPAAHLEIDHIDGDKGNNAIKNLRLATCSQNQANRGPNKNNTSGYKGVTWDKKMHKWHAKICYQRKWYHLGRFDDPKEAHSAYSLAASKFFGEFARVR